MGNRKHLMAEKLKEAKKVTAVAKLNDVPTSPRKMRLVADTVRGVEVNRAIDLLHFSKREASIRLEKLLRSAVANWEAKNPDQAKELDNGNVYVKTIMVDEGRTLKRIRPCPQGRAGRIRKRSNHVTVVLDVKKAQEEK
ncbi:MAG: 50S ribosomal protein L22 [Bacteroidales bacterium]|jgi:large subunit ribosomal protein L22|nr:50S ribosomal protein L22 [Bacteroidales bacterium]